MGTINNFKFKLLKNFFSKKEIDVYSKYCKYRHICDNKDVDNIFNNKLEKFPEETCFFDDPLFESVLLNITKDVEKKCGLKLFPTYSYWRMYTYGASLPKHTDRSSCEISTTMFLGGEDWSIFLEPSGEEGKKGVEVNLKPGDMLMYRGCELEHWRETFEGENCGQVFLHYNDASNPKAKLNKFDGRPMIGLPDYYARKND